MEIWLALSGIVVGVCLGLIVAALARLPPTRVSRPIYGFLAAGTVWTLGDFVATHATDMFWKQTGVFVLYSGAIFLPSFWWLVALRWAEECECPLPFRGRAWTLLPFLWATFIWIAMASNPWHGQFITPIIGGRNVYHPLWWCMAIPNYALVLGALAVELEVVRRVPRSSVRRQAIFPIAASVVTLAANFLWVFGVAPFNATAVVLAISGALLAVGMVRDGLFGVLPIALRVIAANDPDGIVVARADGRVAYLNARAIELLGAIGAGVGKDLPAVLADVGWELECDDGPHSPADSAALWQLLEAPEGALFHAKGEAPRWLHVSARRVLGRRGQARAFCLRVRDVTDERRREVQLRRAHRLESVAEFAGRVADGFHNALAVVLANADLMLSEQPDNPSLQRKLGRITAVAEHALGLAHQLQITAGDLESLRSELELSGFVEEVRDGIVPGFAASVRVELELAEGELTIAADPVQLREVLSSIIVNAKESLPESDGEIHIATGTCWLDPPRVANLVVGREAPAGEYAYVRIADSGSGMATAVQERIFEPFFSTREKQQGNGLASVLAVMRAHRALLELETEPGRGSVFTLYFPLEQEAMV